MDNQVQIRRISTGLNMSDWMRFRFHYLLYCLTLDEKVAMMNHPAQSMPRLNIPTYKYWTRTTWRWLQWMYRGLSAGDWRGCYLGQGLDPPDRHCHQRRGSHQIPRSVSSQGVYRPVSGADLLVAKCQHFPHNKTVARKCSLDRMFDTRRGRRA